MRRIRNKKKYYLILLVILLAGISLGYAFLSTNVNFNGTAVINNAQWNIQLESITPTAGSVTPTSAATISADKTTVSYSVTLTNPGDFYEFTVDAHNTGSIDGMIDTLTSKLNDEAITTLPAYLQYKVNYSDGKEPKKNHFLKSTKKVTFRIRVEFKKDIVASQLPTADQTLNFKFTVAYKQADGNAIEIA